jgi:glutathione S-transferase
MLGGNGILRRSFIAAVSVYCNMSETYQLYQYDRCPFCFRVRRFLDHAGIDIQIRDTLHDPSAVKELVQGGGSSTVPCLRIESSEGIRWLYESLDIIDYLKSRFGVS